MKTVTNVTLTGIVFAVEEDAYTQLATYLKSIEETFAHSPDYAEIAADIEAAMAEKFRARKKNEKKAVTLDDVTAVVAEMGSAQEVGADAGVDPSGSADRTETDESAETTASKRLYRDVDEAIIGGVAAGIARYFAVDPVIVRLVFVLSVFLNGLGLLLYVVLWLIVPEAKTTTDKYAMRGERLTVADITERVKKNLNNEETVAAAKGLWGRIRGFCVEIFNLLGRVFPVLVKLVRLVLGGVLIFASALSLAGFISAVTGLLLSSEGWLGTPLYGLIQTLLANPAGSIFIGAVSFVIIIPLIVLLMLGVSLMSNRNRFNAANSSVLLIVWLIAVCLSGILGIQYAAAVGAVVRVKDESRVHLKLPGGEFRIEETDDQSRMFMKINQ